MSAPRPDDQADILSVATSIAQGTDVDWEAAERTTTDVAVLDELRVLDHLSRLADKVPDSWAGLSIAGELGRGSHGTVYQAHDPNLGIDIALKVVRPRGPAAHTLAATALNEARLLAQVNHPNVVRVFWAEPEGDDIGIAMELLRGRTVRERLRQQGPMTARESAAVGVDLSRALTAVHRARLVHGDVKAGNVMLVSSERTVLMDFGVGQDLKQHDGWIGRAGTPLYQAPELFRGDEPTPQSDIYSLGVLLFHMVTDAYPVDAPDAAGIERHHLERRPPRRLRDLRPDLDTRFVAVVDRALADRPEDRFRTAAELETALSATLITPGHVAGRVAGMAAAAAVVGAILAYMLWPASGARTPAVVTAGTSLAGPVTAAVAAGDAYRVEAAFYRDESGADVKLTQLARVAENDALSLQIQSSVPVYAYVVNEDERGESFLLFPLPDQHLSNPLPPNVRHEIPGVVGGQRIRWRVSSAGGREHFLVFVSPDPPPPDLQQRFASMARPTFGAPVSAQRLDAPTIGVLRGVGGLTKAPAPSAGVTPLSAQYGTPLPEGEDTARGWWIRRLTLENPE